MKGPVDLSSVERA